MSPKHTQTKGTRETFHTTTEKQAPCLSAPARPNSTKPCTVQYWHLSSVSRRQLAKTISRTNNTDNNPPGGQGSVTFGAPRHTGKPKQSGAVGFWRCALCAVVVVVRRRNKVLTFILVSLKQSGSGKGINKQDKTNQGGYYCC
jgi:hypothetical protein